MEVDVASFLSSLKPLVPEEAAPYLDEFQEFYSKKYFYPNSGHILFIYRLWHQLTLKLQSFFLLQGSQPVLIPLYYNFIIHWEKYMNQLSLVSLYVVVARQFREADESILFLQKVAEKALSSPAACILATLEGCHYMLLTGEHDKTRAILEECQRKLEGLHKIEPITGNYSKYYRNALLFLACVELADFSESQLLERAHDLAISALASDQIYNFGELLLHPIFRFLENSEFRWLHELLIAFNAGNISKFEQLSSVWSKHVISFFDFQPSLAGSTALLQQKIRLMALLELVFKRTGHSRFVSFSEIADAAQLPLDQVEFLIMKALSLGLLRGSLDQIAMIFHVTWVQLRVLEKNQIASLKSSVALLREKATETARQLQNDAADFIAV